jgi:hypothetical protein
VVGVKKPIVPAWQTLTWKPSTPGYVGAPVSTAPPVGTDQSRQFATSTWNGSEATRTGGHTTQGGLANMNLTTWPTAGGMTNAYGGTGYTTPTKAPVAAPAAPTGTPYQRRYGDYTHGSGASAGGYTSYGAYAFPTNYYGLLGAGLGGDFASYYDLNGGDKQAYQDYQNLLNMWSNTAGRALTSDDLTRLMQAFAGYGAQLRAMGIAPTVSDLMNFAQRQVAPKPNPTQVSYLNMGNL